jgi:hypothetical protein
VTINGYESRNRGDYILNDSDITRVAIRERRPDLGHRR